MKNYLPSLTFIFGLKLSLITKDSNKTKTKKQNGSIRAHITSTKLPRDSHVEYSSYVHQSLRCTASHSMILPQLSAFAYLAYELDRLVIILPTTLLRCCLPQLKAGLPLRCHNLFDVRRKGNLHRLCEYTGESLDGVWILPLNA